jgi:Holliday junction resolvase-like predicted endonuclease
VKPFKKSLFDKYDPTGRAVVSEWLADLGYWVHDNPDIYGVDLIAEKDGKQTMIEVEVKVGWIDKFPFGSLHIPARKEKFAKTDSVFCILNREMTRLAAVTGDNVLMCGFVTKATRVTDEPDVFFEVPLKFVHFYEIKNPDPGQLDRGEDIT